MLNQGPWKWFRAPRRKRRKGVVLRDVPRRIIWGRRSNLDGVAWICAACQHTNRPTRELFVDLPAFHCSNCNAKHREDFHFSFGNLSANRTFPIGRILNQEDTDDCLPFALAKGAEMTVRICETLSGSHVIVPTMNPYSLKDTFKKAKLAQGIDEAEINYQDDDAVRGMIELLQTVGVQDKAGRFTCKIGGVERVDGYFEDIVKEIANGYPLTVDIITGEEFKNLKYGQVYQCPYNNRTIKDGSKVMMHTVILVGAARLGDIDYFYFLNSAGDKWCRRFHRSPEKRTIGGIGKLAADDICCRPYKFLRACLFELWLAGCGCGCGCEMEAAVEGKLLI